MSKVILICGKICSGKTYYAQKLVRSQNKVLLSCDEIMLSFAENGFALDYDQLSERVKAYLLQKAVEIVSCGTEVILDWGFWSKGERQRVIAFFNRHGVKYEWHYVDISDVDWKLNIQERNRAVAQGDIEHYLLDEGLFLKMNRIFEIPERSEMDVWYQNQRAVR